LNESGAADPSELCEKNTDSSELYDPFATEEDAGESTVEKEEVTKEVASIGNNTQSASSPEVECDVLEVENDSTVFPPDPPAIDIVEGGTNKDNECVVLTDFPSDEAELTPTKPVQPVRKTSTRGGRRSSTRKTRKSKEGDESHNDVISNDEKQDVDIVTDDVIQSKNIDVNDEDAEDEDGINNETDQTSESITETDDTDVVSDSEIMEEEVVPKTRKGVKRKAPARPAKRARGRAKGKRKK